MLCLNIGKLDRILRIAAGVTLLAFALGLALPGADWRGLGWLGLIPLVTGLIGYCPAYAVAEISTRTKQNLP